MIIGHSSIPRLISNWIYAFHMPLFFIASGITTDWSKYSIYYFIKKKANSLLLPFFVYSVISAILLKLTGIWEIDLSQGWIGYALWFVPVLFVSLIFAKLIFCLKGFQFFFIFILLPILSELLYHKNIILPWNMSSVSYAIFFIILGNLFERFILNYFKLNYFVFLISFLLSFIISNHWRLDMASNHVCPIILLTISAISGTLFIFHFSILIEQKFQRLSSLFQIIGKETFLIIAFSQIIIQELNLYFQINTYIKYFLLIVILIFIKFIKDYLLKYSKLLCARLFIGQQ